jgi:hypothetical protein
MADKDNSPVLGTGDKKELQWSTAKIQDALAWHTPTDTTHKGLGAKTSRSSDDLPGIVAASEATAVALPHVVSETDLAARSETNVFRLSDANINRAFSNTTQKANIQVTRKALDALQRADSSADSPSAEQRSLSAERQRLRRNVSTETSTFADYVISRAGKLVVAMVGAQLHMQLFRICSRLQCCSVFEHGSSVLLLEVPARDAHLPMFCAVKWYVYLLC